MSANIQTGIYSVDAPQRVGGLTGVPRLLSKFGVPIARVRDGLDFDPRALEDPDFRLPFAMVGQVMARCALETGCDHFGLLLGAAHDFDSLGLPGGVMRHSSTLAAAISEFVRLQPMNSRGAAAYLRRFDDAVVTGYGIYHRGALGHEQIYQFAMAVASNVVRSLTGGAAEPTEVHFSIRPPADQKPFLAHFRAPVRFNQPETGLILSHGAFELPVVGANPAELARFRKQISPAQAPEAMPWIERVRHEMKPLLLQGEPTASAMAAHLGLSLRTLTRRLSEEGLGFQAILAEVRFSAAQELLLLTDLPVGDIAQALSYAAHAPFVEAFRRWSGMPPSAWRAANARK
jgi:AraC-like DNA-binding protein